MRTKTPKQTSRVSDFQEKQAKKEPKTAQSTRETGLSKGAGTTPAGYEILEEEDTSSF